MRVITKRRRFLGLAFWLPASFLIAMFFVPQSARAFTLVPASNDVHLYPGEKVTARVVVTADNAPLAADVVVKQVDIDSQDRLQLTPLVPDHPLAPTLSVDAVDLATGDSADVLLSLTAPTEGSGRSILAVAVRDTQGTVQGSVMAHTEILSLLFISYGPVVPEDAALRDIQPLESTVDSLLDVGVAMTIENTSRYIVRPTVLVTVKNIFGKTVAQLAREEARLSIPAGQKRTLTYVMPKSEARGLIREMKGFGIGRYAVEMTFVPKSGAHAQTSTLYVTVIPWRALSVFAAAVVSVFGILLLRILKRRHAAL